MPAVFYPVGSIPLARYTLVSPRRSTASLVAMENNA